MSLTTVLCVSQGIVEFYLNVCIIKKIVPWQLLQPLPAFTHVSNIILTFSFGVTSIREAFEVYVVF